MEQERNKENMDSYVMKDWEGDVNVADNYFCSLPLHSTSNIMSKGTWNILDTSNLHWLCSANLYVT